MVGGLTPARKAPIGVTPAATSTSTAPFLIGCGYDIHRLAPAQAGRKLVLGGVAVADDIATIAHSDGDVIYHAVVDAIIGALGMGDIGELFPDSDPLWKDADSSKFVADVVDRARNAGYRVSNADVSLLLERPKIASFKSLMISNLRRLLHGASAVNVKAGTNEGCDSIGRGEAVAAHAVVLLARIDAA